MAELDTPDEESKGNEGWWRPLEVHYNNIKDYYVIDIAW